MTLEEPRPTVLLGANRGANPVEYLLVALSGCVTTSLIAQASARGIRLRSVSSRLEGEIDLRGFLGISPDVPVGYKRIRFLFTIDADISEAEKAELLELARSHSPVYDTVTGPVPVDVALDTA